MENINVRVGAGGDRKSDLVVVPLTHPEVIAWITARTYDEETRLELVRAVKQYPGVALREFVNNINCHVGRIQRARRDKDQESGK